MKLVIDLIGPSAPLADCDVFIIPFNSYEPYNLKARAKIHLKARAKSTVVNVYGPLVTSWKDRVFWPKKRKRKS